MNFAQKRGAVGFISLIFPFLVPYRLVKVDPDTGEILRDPDTGLCILCKPGEPGELVAPIFRGNALRDFDGYLDKKATSKKVLRDVFKKGDSCFK